MNNSPSFTARILTTRGPPIIRYTGLSQDPVAMENGRIIVPLYYNDV